MTSFKMSRNKNKCVDLCSISQIYNCPGLFVTHFIDLKSIYLRIKKCPEKFKEIVQSHWTFETKCPFLK